MTPPMNAATSPQLGAREALYATSALLASLWIGKHLAIGPAAPVIYTALAAMQLYLPLWLIQRAGEMPESHGIHVHGALLAPLASLRKRLVLARRRQGKASWQGRSRQRRPMMELLATYGRGAVWRPMAFRKDMGAVLVLCAVFFPPFALAHFGWQSMLGLHHKAFRVPPDILVFWAKNTFLIALPEELFYRGFLETRLERWWPTKRSTLFGIPLGRTVFVASALFALGHFLGEYNPARLGPFFPAFLFSALTRRSGSIAGAVAFHGLCNTFSYLLAAGYR
jgi:membrane protease YdiL (CAAX protease family)